MDYLKHNEMEDDNDSKEYVSFKHILLLHKLL